MIKKLSFNHIPIKASYQSRDNRNFNELFNLKWQHFNIVEKDNIEEI